MNALVTRALEERRNRYVRAGRARKASIWRRSAVARSWTCAVPGTLASMIATPRPWMCFGTPPQYCHNSGGQYLILRPHMASLFPLT